MTSLGGKKKKMFLHFQPGCGVRNRHGYMSFPGGSDGKESAYDTGDWDSIPGSGRFPGEGNGNLVQYCCLEDPVDRGAW